MRKPFNDGMFTLIGDVHIGKKFKNGVPLNRRGEREILLKEHFRNCVQEGIQNVEKGVSRGIIQLGDLFDSFCVNYEDLRDVFSILSKVNVPFYILAGNHDISKNQDKTSALRILAWLLAGNPNVKIVIDSPLVFRDINGGINAMVPYKHCLEEGESLLPDPRAYGVNKFSRIYGHFEEPFPLALTEIADKVYTGHIHAPRVENNVTVVGSIMPLTFAEDPLSEMMLTMTLSEYEATKASGFDFHNFCLRINLKNDETLPDDVDCLQIISMRNDVEDNNEDINVDYDMFNIEEMFHEALDELGLFEEFYNLYLENKLAASI